MDTNMIRFQDGSGFRSFGLFVEKLVENRVFRHFVQVQVPRGILLEMMERLASTFEQNLAFYSAASAKPHASQNLSPTYFLPRGPRVLSFAWACIA